MNHYINMALIKGLFGITTQILFNYDAAVH
jgi:hypothetical protein